MHDCPLAQAHRKAVALADHDQDTPRCLGVSARHSFGRLDICLRLGSPCPLGREVLPSWDWGKRRGEGPGVYRSDLSARVLQCTDTPQTPPTSRLAAVRSRLAVDVPWGH